MTKKNHNGPKLEGAAAVACSALLACFVRLLNFILVGTSKRENLPETGSTRAHEPQPNLERREHTTPPLSRLPAILLHPLTKVGRKNLPLYYLVRPPTQIAPAPNKASLSKKMRRRCEGAAIALWWPIGKALTLFWLWRDPPCPRTVLAWWQVQKADHRGHTAAVHPIECRAMSWPPTLVLQSSIPMCAESPYALVQANE